MGYRDLGCFGHIAELRRTEVEPFTAEDLVTLERAHANPRPISKGPRGMITRIGVGTRPNGPPGMRGRSPRPAEHTRR